MPVIGSNINQDRLFLDRKLIERVDKMLAEDIAKLMTMVPLEETTSKNEGTDRYNVHFCSLSMCSMLAHFAVVFTKGNKFLPCISF